MVVRIVESHRDRMRHNPMQRERIVVAAIEIIIGIAAAAQRDSLPFGSGRKRRREIGISRARSGTFR